MIRMTVELVPFGDESNKKTICTAEIANMGYVDKHVDPNLCKYRVVVDGDRNALKIECEVEHFRDEGIMRLLATATETTWYDAVVREHESKSKAHKP